MQPRKNPIRPRQLFHHAGVGVGGSYGVHLNSLVNVRRALVERVYHVERAGKLVPTPRPVAGVVNNALRVFRSQLLKCLPTLHPLSAAQFVELYTGRRRVIYGRAAEEFIRSGVKPKHSKLKAFVKAEKIFLDDKPDPAPRIIQPRDLVYNVAVGRYLKHAEKPMFNAIKKVFNGQAVYKGMNASAIAGELRNAWESFTRPVAVGYDASRFDQHVSRDALEWEHSVWPKLFACESDRKELRGLLKQQLHNHGTAYADDGKIQYAVEGCRMSGDMNTSSGNCLLMCAMMWSYSRSVGLEKFKLANNGDDCVMILDRKDLWRVQTLPSWFSKLGFTMKVEKPVYEFEQIDFCQTSPVFTAKGWVMSRSPHKAMAKDLHANCDIKDPRVRANWCHAMWMGGTALADGVPMWQAFYGCFEAKRAGKDHGLNPHYESGLYSLMRGMVSRNTPITPEARYSFWVAYGILPDQQIAFEQHCKTIRLSQLPYKPDAPKQFGDVFWLPGDKLTTYRNYQNDKNEACAQSNEVWPEVSDRRVPCGWQLCQPGQ